MDDAPLANLYFEDSEEWHRLPEWADYFISVGKQFAYADSDSISRIVTAIVVPTRAYCAAFVGFGMVVCDAAKREQLSEIAHFKMLLDLPPGTPVIYLQGTGKILKGIMQPPQESDGEQWVRVQVSAPSMKGGGVIQLINKAIALKVQPATHSGKLPQKQSGKNKRLSNEFVNILLGDPDPVQLGIQSKYVCAIVGKKSLLEYEIRQTPFAVHRNGGNREKGLLQDVLRVDRFISGEKSHRSALVPIGISQPSSDIISKIETGVVFDGAAGFLKWGTMFQNRHQVIILDRTERYFDDAIHSINSRFLQNRADVELLLPDSALSVPPGTEMLAFREMIS